MTNYELIMLQSPPDLAKFLHSMQAGALIEMHADSEEELLDWLNEEKENEQ